MRARFKPHQNHGQKQNYKDVEQSIKLKWLSDLVITCMAHLQNFKLVSYSDVVLR